MSWVRACCEAVLPWRQRWGLTRADELVRAVEPAVVLRLVLRVVFRVVLRVGSGPGLAGKVL